MATIMNHILMCLVKRPVFGHLLIEGGTDALLLETGDNLTGEYK